MFAAGDRIGHYEIVRALDKGGMGYVFLARHTTLDVEYAVKVLKPEIAENGEYASRFLREGKLASKIRHPNLIAVYDAGRDEATGVNYLVMDYVPGGTLADLVRKEGALPAERALGIVRQVAAALVTAEEHGMVHRDIKPANIMFDRDGRVKLADLGIAKGGEEVTAMTCSESVFGTPAYMSPEQARDSGKVDCRTDIYSLGMVLWQMLTGERPYGERTAIEIMAALLSATPFPDVRERNPSVPKAVARLVQEMCQKRREKRIASAADLLKRLDALTGADDVTVPTVCVNAGSQAVRSPVVVRRSFGTGRLLLVASALVTIAVVVLVVLSRQKDEDWKIPVQTVDEALAVRESAVQDQPDVAENVEDERQEEKARKETERIAEERKAETERREAERLAAEAKRLADEKAKAERLAAEKARREAKRIAAEKLAAEKLAAKKAEERRLADEARLAAAAMVGTAATSEPAPKAVVRKKVAEPPKQDFVKLARTAFGAGNWSLGYQYALQDTTGNPEVLLWLGKCFDPAVEMPGFHRHKKDPDLARRYYRQSAEKGNAEAERALKRL